MVFNFCRNGKMKEASSFLEKVAKEGLPISYLKANYASLLEKRVTAGARTFWFSRVFVS